MSDKIAALVVAAGFSSRMHSFKPLLPLGEGRVIEKPINTLLHAGVRDVRVVVGHNADSLCAVLKNYDVKTIYNERYAAGMFSSIIAGVNSLENDVSAFFIWPADIPLVQVKTLRKLLCAYKNSRKGIIYPCYYGSRGHPPLISAKYKEKIVCWQGSGGLRGLLNSYNTDSLDIPVNDKGVTLDMDTKKDYHQVLSYYDNNYNEQLPDAAECAEILNKFAVSVKVINHSAAVAKVAASLADQLNQAGCCLDGDLINAAALLHDIAKGQPNHAEKGAEIIKRLGYHSVAEIVACHNDIKLHVDDCLTEAQIVYLADKLVKEDRVVSLEERFKEAEERCVHNPEIMAKVLSRRRNAATIYRRVKELLGSRCLDEKVETWNNA